MAIEKVTTIPAREERESFEYTPVDAEGATFHHSQLRNPFDGLLDVSVDCRMGDEFAHGRMAETPSGKWNVQLSLQSTQRFVADTREEADALLRNLLVRSVQADARTRASMRAVNALLWDGA